MIGQVRIKRPGKFLNCKHLQVFDVDCFLEAYCQSLQISLEAEKNKADKDKKVHLMKCPMCQNEESTKHLRIFDYYQKILNEITENEIELKPDGNWNKIAPKRNLQPVVDLDLVVKNEPGVQIQKETLIPSRAIR